MDRLPKRTKDKSTKFNLGVLKRVFGNWHWYLFVMLWSVAGENISYCVNTLFALWLKHAGYSVAQRNNYPLGIYAVGIISTFGTSLYVDLTGAKYHWHVAIWICLTLTISTILLLVKPLDPVPVFIAHILAGTSYSGQAIYFAWCNVVCSNDLEERAITLASMNMFSSVVNSWWSIVFYKATDVPKWRKGCFAMFGTCFATLFIAGTLRFLQLRDQKVAAGHVEDDESLSTVDQEQGDTVGPVVDDENVSMNNEKNKVV
ncbi:unnamed protein product [Ambrosiozyma monospora]|uniref:Unnamed protein product n=1 Tax=Ambrosiozyma monospora TaxID=43982 RepID=A0ACB5T3V7_AMBMO|nr:unnamed protein product [Ambrosiozyma monospora]